MNIIKGLFVWGAGIVMIKLAILSSLIEIGYEINGMLFTVTLTFGAIFLAIAILINDKT